MKKSIFAFLVSGIWIGFSEFLRNELLFKSFWLDKYRELGLIFPSSNLNNAFWGVWSFILAFIIVFLSRKLRLVETVAVSWIAAFVLMWIVIGNLNVLPFGLLTFAVPWSILEILVAALICRRIMEIGS